MQKRSSVGVGVGADCKVGFDQCIRIHFCVCVSFLSLQEKEGFSLCLCLGFDQRIFVNVCRGEIHLHHEGLGLGLGLRFNFCCVWVC